MRTDFLLNKLRSLKGFIRQFSPSFRSKTPKVHHFDEINEYDKMKMETLIKRELDKRDNQRDITAI